MTENLTDEQLRAMAESFNNPRVRAAATELLALRAERAKATQNDEERARDIAGRWYMPLLSFQVDDLTKQLASAFSSIRAEGSAERAKLEGSLIQSPLDEELMKRTLLKCYGSKVIGIRVSTEHYRYLAEQIVSLRVHIKRALVQPAESGATERQCDCCGQMKECENVVAFGMDTTVCAECRDVDVKNIEIRRKMDSMGR
jgi:hypothetical protein